MKGPFDDIFSKAFGNPFTSGPEQTQEIRTVIKCTVCAQKNRLAPGATGLVRGPLGPKCGRCKQPLGLV